MKKTKTDSINYETRKKNLMPIKTLCDVPLIKPKKLYFSCQFIKQKGNPRKT